ncbi:MAG: hypothetical protein RLZZ271_942 [Pseudomonadota bacterium]|jgi:adenosylhomocysteine nucleosidase
MTTAIVSALPEEQAALRQQLAQATEVRLASRTFLSGTLCGQPVVLALSGIGKVAAAITASTLIHHFRATQLVFTGVAGGLHKTAMVGDVVVASELLQHDMDASPLAPRHVVPQTGLSRFPVSERLSALLLQACREVLRQDSDLLALLRTFHPAARAAVHRGLVVSGDQFINSVHACHRLRNELPDALAVEMEGASVAQVCHDHGVEFAIMRTISDRADATAHVDFLAFVRDVACIYSDRVVTNWLSRQQRDVD